MGGGGTISGWSLRWSFPLLTICLAGAPVAGRAQTAADPGSVPYEAPPTWQTAAVAALNRHLPLDSGYFVLGPLDLDVDLPDTTDLVRTTLRIIAADPEGSRSVARRLWIPTGGVALEELQPSDTLLPKPPPGYPGRFLRGAIVGEDVLVQVLTVNEHRWLLWAKRVGVAEIRGQVSGPIARYSQAVAEYLQALDAGPRGPAPPRTTQYGLDSTYDLFAPPPAPVVGSRQGYLDLLQQNRAFSLDDRIRDVYAFVPGPSLQDWLEGAAPRALFSSKAGERALQHRYRDYRAAGGRWGGMPELKAAGLERLSPGAYVYIVDRYGVVRVARTTGTGLDVGGSEISAALLAHGDPVRAAGTLTLVAGPDRSLGVGAANVASAEYFFSNLSLSLYEDVEERSDGYVLALGHLLKGLRAGRVSANEILLQKF